LRDSTAASQILADSSLAGFFQFKKPTILHLQAKNFQYAKSIMVDLDFKNLLTDYRQGERHFPGICIKIADGFECDLNGVDLQDSHLLEAYMPYSNLSKANLQRVTVEAGNLSDTKFFSSNLHGASLVGVNLSRADFRFACLRGVNLSGCNLMGADFQDADLTDANLKGADLTGANFNRATLTNTNLQGSNLFRACSIELKDAVCDRTTIMPDGHYY
jgi:uncharacterized protein YjbI with pentapeptide repeats